jgi:hypothetical protein
MGWWEGILGLFAILFGGAMTGPLVRKRNRPGPLEWLLAVVGCAIVGIAAVLLVDDLVGHSDWPTIHPWWTGAWSLFTALLTLALLWAYVRIETDESDRAQTELEVDKRSQAWVWRQPDGQIVAWVRVLFRVRNHDRSHLTTVPQPVLGIRFGRLPHLKSHRPLALRGSWTDVKVDPATRTGDIDCTFAGWWNDRHPDRLELRVSVVGGQTHRHCIPFETWRQRGPEDRLIPFQNGPTLADVHHLVMRAHPTYPTFAQSVQCLRDGQVLAAGGGAWDGGEGWQDLCASFSARTVPEEWRMPCVVVGSNGRIGGVFLAWTGDDAECQAALRGPAQ